ncbi:MAG: type II toxin-antitoxin system RelE/ParE family toxin [Nitrospira sp.]|nr:type II toxin-antitoxin system RelE/ParE family toxin [Nitrospira sp.]HMS86296.1 type II toxin-antitoxin system RelE/ParE family toxin [Nitrospira sp.]
MAWTIEYDRRVLKDLKRLDRQAQQAILEYFDDRIAPTEDPRVFGKPLKASFAGLWRYRIGDYRAICRIEDHSMVVLVVRVAHRSTVYED